MRKLSYKEMREKGLCTKCGKENPTPEKSMCPICAKKNSENRKNNREYRRKIGVCTRCGKNKAEPHKKLCLECLGADQDRYAEKKATDEQREKDRLKKRELAEERRAKGLCTRCGKHTTESGGICSRCKAYLKRYRDNHRQDIMRSERADYGICYICGKAKVMKDKKVCPDCYETRLKTLPAMWANPNNEYFKQLNYARYCMVKNRRKQNKGGCS